MPLVVKTGYLNVKDENGQYIRNTTIAEQTTQEQVTEINTAGTANINAIEQKGVETLASIPDDYTELSGEVADLKSALKLPNEISGGSEGTKPVSYSTGNLITGSSLLHTDYVDLTGIEKIVYTRLCTTSSSSTAGIAFYTSEKVYISGERAKLNQTASYYEMTEIDVPANAVYARFSMFNTIDGFAVYNSDDYYASIPVVVDNLEHTVNQHSVTLDEIASGGIVFNYDETDLISRKAINSNGEEITSNTSYCTDYIKSYGYCEIKSVFTYDSSAIASSWYQYVCFYDSNKTFISRNGGEKQAEVNTQAPGNTAYIRISLTYVNLSSLQDYALTETVVISNQKTPVNKWYVLGDSISAGYYSMTASMAEAAGVEFDYDSPVTTEQGEATGSVWDKTLEHNYWGYANRWILKRQQIGKAYPGQGYYRTAANSQNGVYVVKNNDFSDAGLITVAWGFNDWHYNVNRGNHDLIDPAVPYPTADYDTSQITTINQAIWYCLGELIRQAPNAMIIVQTPMNGWAYGGDWSTDWGIGYTKSNSGKLSDIHDDIVYWANYYGLRVLDMTYGNSIVNRRNIKDTIIDGSHPSDAAHQQLGRYVAEMLGYC